MKKFFLWLVLAAMVLSTVLFTLGCPKPKDPAEPLTPTPAGGDTGGGDAGGVLDEGGG